MKYIISLFWIIMLAGCTKLPVKKMVNSWEEVPSGEVVVVGKVVLSPPLQEVEQALLTGKYGRYKKMVVMATAPEYRSRWKNETVGFNGRVEAFINKTFYASFPAKTHYYMGSFLFLETQRDEDIMALLPGGLVIDIQPSDTAIYIGSIHYKRNEFNEIVDARIIDEYEEEMSLFQEKFGAGVPLRKALLQKM